MKQVLKYTGYVLLLLIIGFFIWRFYYILGWILVALVISFIGEPLVMLFDRLHIRKIKMPHTISALMALIVIVLVFAGLIAVFVPLILNQAETISKIDVGELAHNLQGKMQWADGKLHSFGVIPPDQNIMDYLVLKAKSVVDLGSVGSILGNIISFAGNVFIGLFAILFIAFFFLKDQNMFQEGLFMVIPEKHHESTKKVVAESKNLLIRYYVGVIAELICVMSLIAIGLSIFGVKNALLIGFFGGIMNIIPYLGPIIGSVIGVMLGITSILALGTYDELLPVTIKLIGVFLVVNFVDNNILVPYIYSKSVKSHPLEIFLVIIIGGGLAGLIGMLLAVPVYTLLRVIAKEFFQQFRFVRKLTDNIDEE